MLSVIVSSKFLLLLPQNRPASSSSSSTAVADDVVVGAYREQISALRNRVAELETAAEKAKQEKLLAEQNPLENVSVLRKLLEEKDLEAAQLRRELDERIAAETQGRQMERNISWNIL